jgi:TolB-like protein/Flp pilus assembly protein TadD
MKLCPKCQRAYSDESLRFCRDDGTALRVTHTDDPTAILSAPSGTNMSSDLASSGDIARGPYSGDIPAPASTTGSLTPHKRSRKAIDSLAVLPLVNTNANSEMEYFSDGVTESIINALSQLPKLRVVARSTVFRYKGRDVDPRLVGQELGVRAVLTGRIQQVGNGLMIGAELIDVVNDAQLWGERYNRQLADIFEVQEDIAHEISEKLRLKLTGSEKKRLRKRPTADTEAYQLYLKGRFFWNQRTGEAIKTSVDYFERAIGKDPTYAQAYAGLADAYNVMDNYGLLPGKDCFPLAKAAAMKALEIDEALAEAHTSLAHAVEGADWNWSAAEQEYRRAIELNSNYATAHHWYGFHLFFRRKFEPALKELKQAQLLDPLSHIVNMGLAWGLFHAGEYVKSIQQCLKTLELNPNFFVAQWVLGRNYEQQGRYSQAVAEFQKASKLSGGDPEIRALLGHTYAISGKAEKAKKIVKELEEESTRHHVSAYSIARVYVGLEEKARALEWLQTAVDQRHFLVKFLNVDPQFNSLRSEPKFSELLHRIGLA